MINLYEIKDVADLFKATKEIERIANETANHYICPSKHAMEDVTASLVNLVNVYISWTISELTRWRLCYNAKTFSVTAYMASNFEVPEGYINPNPEV